MKHLLSYCLGAAALLAVPAGASAATLFDQTNLPKQLATTESFNFIAGSTSTTIDFQGYQIPGSIVAVNIALTAAGSTTNLLGAHWLYTAAACGASATEGSLSASTGTYDLVFGGTCAGSYDSFAQTLSTMIGTSYTLSFVLTNDAAGATITPNGLRVFANGPTIAGVPEPASWGMMLAGFAGIGFQLRRSRRKAVLPQAA